MFADQLVRGPLTTENVEEGLATGRWTLDTLIWWKGQAQWMSIANWRVMLPGIGAEQEQKQTQQQWYLESKGTQTGPMTRSELVSFLKAAANPFQFSLWTPGFQHWKKLYFFEEFLNELGMSRRAHPRAPISGAAEIAKREQKFVLQTTTISAGGVGLIQGHGLVPGQTVQLTVRSPAFPNPIRSTAQIMYVRPDGMAGAKFNNIHIEAQSTIVDYVRQFEDAEKQPEPALPDPKKAA
ncbi:MAG TPA: PilZ domain-containing protein [Bdellovibrionales bacterium]|nr:PilZ domain-containing protein [Bdellovibrionales bacterium]